VSKMNKINESVPCTSCQRRTRGVFEGKPYCYNHNPSLLQLRSAKKAAWYKTEKGRESSRRSSYNYFIQQRDFKSKNDLKIDSNSEVQVEVSG
jgi:hypothetical protein